MYRIGINAEHDSGSISPGKTFPWKSSLVATIEDFANIIKAPQKYMDEEKYFSTI